MLDKLTHINLWVRDQDEALEFFTEKVGFELRDDVTMAEMGGYRFLTVGPVGQPDVHIILNTPSPPIFAPEDVPTVERLIAKGSLGGFSFAVEDLQAVYEDLKSRGVEFFQEPHEVAFGLDAAFRDPSGNHFRVIQTS